MKSVIYGISAMLVISAIAWVLSGTISESSSERYTSHNNSVRLD